MSSSIPPEYTRRMMSRLLGWVPLLLGVVGAVWVLHSQSVAHAERMAIAEVRIDKLEDSMGKIGAMADDIAAIRQALGVEQGWRRGLLQSLPSPGQP